MNYIDAIFSRADIQHIRESLINGCECVEIDSHSYKERIERPLKEVNKRVHEIYSTEGECDKMMTIIFAYANAVENVYMEIGLQVGAMLCAQMYRNFKDAPKE